MAENGATTFNTSQSRMPVPVSAGLLCVYMVSSNKNQKIRGFTLEPKIVKDSQKTWYDVQLLVFYIRYTQKAQLPSYIVHMCAYWTELVCHIVTYNSL
jgi:hypothetical protein